VQAFSHFSDALPFIEPQQGLRAAQTVGGGGMEPQLFQLLAFFRTEYQGSHCFTASRLVMQRFLRFVNEIFRSYLVVLR
jgi:hypothetical protein